MLTKGRTDPNKIALIRKLRSAATKNQAKIWKILASELSKSNRKRVAINLSQINRNSSKGDIILVPGKVLGAGNLGHNLEIAAESFSESAQLKIQETGGSCISIEELLNKNPSGSGVRLMK
ncbi:MAG: 50S ribosomal protein L18e [Candidatus Heimdallarchaeota archaeon]|nr:50S ribosomal protein L18e [Candidatus Heimdallarchaeota archaeon]